MLETSQHMVHEFAWLVLSPQLKKLAAQLQHEVQRLKALPPKLRFIQRHRSMKRSFKY
jgi:hypothetical protein